MVAIVFQIKVHSSLGLGAHKHAILFLTMTKSETLYPKRSCNTTSQRIPSGFPLGLQYPSNLLFRQLEPLRFYNGYSKGLRDFGPEHIEFRLFGTSYSP